jgi:transposase
MHAKYASQTALVLIGWQHQSLFTKRLDVVFYDVTTLFFDSQAEEEWSLRQKGFSKDGKAHRPQIVFGLLADKLRNLISYHVYGGNTCEGKTMPDALNYLKSKYRIDNVMVVADSAMIDKSKGEQNRFRRQDYIEVSVTRHLLSVRANSCQSQFDCSI